MPAVLIIEDDDNIAALLRFMFERDGHDVTVLADGEVAWQHLHAQPPPSIVLLDAMLPYRDGVSLLRAMRAHAPWRAVPVLMLTARSLERDVVDALESGANDYVMKPFQPQELMARVRRLLAIGRAA